MVVKEYRKKPIVVEAFQVNALDLIKLQNGFLTQAQKSEFTVNLENPQNIFHILVVVPQQTTFQLFQEIIGV